MANPDIVLNELKEISPFIAEIKKVNIYSAPPSYFNNLAENILQNITSVNEPVNILSSVTPYKIDENYFDNLSNSILERVRNKQKESNEVIDELTHIAPLLNTISKATTFSVPDGYFENFQGSYKSLIKQNSKLQVVTHKFTRYAVAAVITMLMAVGVYLITGRVDKRSGAQAVNVKSAVKDLRDEEIIEFLRIHSSLNNNGNVSSHKKSPASKFNESLKQMTDEEIQYYLQENLEAGEIEVDI